MSGVEVTLEHDPVPLSCVIATTIRRSLASGVSRSARVRGVVVLASSVNAQAVTMRFNGTSIHVERGAAPDADVVISADIDRMSEPDAPNPKVTGLARHPRLALAASKVLDPPLGTWQEEARRFFEFALADPLIDRPIRVVCADDGEELFFGREQGADAGVRNSDNCAIELHGTARDLVNSFSGTTHIAEEILAEKVQVIADLRDLALLGGKFFEWMFGEQHWTTSA